MIKKKLNFVAVILALASLSARSEECNFPQHFKVAGPSGTRIFEVNPLPNGDLTVIKTSDQSFDVLDNTDCKGNGINGIKLKVGIDSLHYSEIGFSDNHNGKILIVMSGSTNGFCLKEFKDITKVDFQLKYTDRCF